LKNTPPEWLIGGPGRASLAAVGGAQSLTKGCILTFLHEAENPLLRADERDAHLAIVSTAADMARDWAADREHRIEPVRLTEAFQTAIPVLRHLDWRVSDAARGFCESVLPLSVESSNQHIAHQAALVLLAADYTGGVALGSLLYEVPVVGVNPQKSDYGAYLWGAKADIKWIRPSSDDLICSARIPVDRHEFILRRFLQGKRVLETVYVEMRNGDALVAEANVTY
jgi:acyl-coenzyme A thioesterase PaaI-like protein